MKRPIIRDRIKIGHKKIKVNKIRNLESKKKELKLTFELKKGY
jgi:hypothetical protein